MSVHGVQQKKTQRGKGTRGKVEGADLVFTAEISTVSCRANFTFLFLSHFYHLLIIRDF